MRAVIVAAPVISIFWRLASCNIFRQRIGSSIPEMSKGDVQQQLSQRGGDKQKQPSPPTHPPEGKIEQGGTDHDARQTKQYAAPNYVANANTSISCWS